VAATLLAALGSAATQAAEPPAGSEPRVRIAASFEVPFVDSVTMSAGWMRWLASVPPANTALPKEEPVDGTLTWDHSRHGPMPWMQFFYDWRFGDLNGDGRIDFIQTNGTYRQIAYDAGGSVLWRYEDPEGKMTDVRYDAPFPIADLDGDGVPELVCARRVEGAVHLAIVNARDGTLLRSVPFPNRVRGDWVGIRIVNASGASIPGDVLVYWNCRSATLLDRNLQTLWSHANTDMPERRHRPLAHTAHNADIDGDGRDELLLGSCLFTPEGRLLWAAPDLPALVKDGHADSVQLCRMKPGGPFRALMSTGAYAFSAEGEFLWGHDELKHGQTLHVGRIRKDSPDLQAVVYEGVSRVVPGSMDRVIAFDADGQRLWDFEVYQPDLQEGGFGFWLGDWDGDEVDEVFVNGREEVFVLNGAGAVIEKFPGHLIYLFDLVGDLRVEAITLTGIEPGMKLQFLANTTDNPHPATNREPARRQTTPAMTNCTRY
jgi:hypothetical protein